MVLPVTEPVVVVVKLIMVLVVDVVAVSQIIRLSHEAMLVLLNRQSYKPVFHAKDGHHRSNIDGAVKLSKL